MNVRCKFYVQSVERQGYPRGAGEGAEPSQPETTGIKVNLAPVYAPKDARCENAKFWQATPSGQMWMQINNPACFDFFHEGVEYYLTIEKA